MACTMCLSLPSYPHEDRQQAHDDGDEGVQHGRPAVAAGLVDRRFGGWPQVLVDRAIVPACLPRRGLEEGGR